MSVKKLNNELKFINTFVHVLCKMLVNMMINSVVFIEHSMLYGTAYTAYTDESLWIFVVCHTTIHYTMLVCLFICAVCVCVCACVSA